MSTRFHLWRALVAFLQGNSMMYAAAIAFYTLFSFFPLILILLNLGGVFIHRFGLETQLVESVRFTFLSVPNSLRTICAASRFHLHRPL
jgi:uncharacterized BrkB/YihY/UPF0761 family membrane protein